jgi:hypothetical protein
MAGSTGRCVRATDRAAREILMGSPRGAQERSMRPIFRPSKIALILPLAAASLLATARAGDMPIRKAGLWEIRLVETSSKIPGMTMQQCTDPAIDRELTANVAPMSKQVCSKTDVRRTAAGYVADAVCSVNGLSVTSHSDIIGDFNSAYTVKVTSHHEGGPAQIPRDTAMTIEARWIGPCKDGQKPGDMIMPGGFKVNIKDMQTLKSMLPK